MLPLPLYENPPSSCLQLGLSITPTLLPTLLTYTYMHLYSLHYSHTHACTYTTYITPIHVHALIKGIQTQGLRPQRTPLLRTPLLRTQTHTHTTNITTPNVPLLRLSHGHSSPSEKKVNSSYKEHTKHYCTHTCTRTHSHMHTLTVAIPLPFTPVYVSSAPAVQILHKDRISTLTQNLGGQNYHHASKMCYKN